MIIVFPDSSFGHWLRKQRLQLGLTPEQFAKEVCCSTELLLQLECGCLLELDSQLCHRLFCALHISPDTYFLSGEI